MKEITLDSGRFNISGILKTIEDHYKQDAEYWFRGQANSKYKLLPSIFRQGDRSPDKPVKLDEAMMIEEFKRHYPEHRHDHLDIFEWLSLMQHYGLPTRILDWSTNLLVGVYFAVEKGEHDGAIYIIDPKALALDHMKSFYDINTVANLTSTNSAGELVRMLIEKLCRFHVGIIDSDIPVAFRVSYENTQGIKSSWESRVDTLVFHSSQTPQEVLRREIEEKLPEHFTLLDITLLIEKNGVLEKGTTIEGALLGITHELKVPHLNNRIRAQHGVFTLHGGKFIDGHEIIPFVEPEMLFAIETASPSLKLIIPKEAKPHLVKELAYAGITKAHLFPDMQQIAESIKTQYTSDM